MKRTRACLVVILATTAFWLASFDAAFAVERLCALREGASGPCTCKTGDDRAGEFTIVDRSKCRRRKTASARGKPKSQTEAALPAAEVANPETSAAGLPSGVDEAASSTSPDVDVTASIPGRLDQIRARGTLRCGVNTDLRGFSAKSASGEWEGLDVDFCHAVAIAALGRSGQVTFVPLDAAARFDALRNDEIDLLSRNSTWNMNRDVALSLDFPGIIYFDGQGFMTSAESGLVSAQQLSGETVCVQSGTTSEANMAYYFKTHGVTATVKTVASREELLKSYTEGVCGAYTADRSALFSDRASFADPLAHVVLPEVISKEPLGPAVKQGDAEWEEIVRWTLAGLINAEETGLDRAGAASSSALGPDAERLVAGAAASGKALRLSETWLRDVVAAVGNYGEIFDTNVGAQSPLGMDRGLNALWKRGGILFAPPMW